MIVTAQLSMNLNATAAAAMAAATSVQNNHIRSTRLVVNGFLCMNTTFQNKIRI